MIPHLMVVLTIPAASPKKTVFWKVIRCGTPQGIMPPCRSIVSGFGEEFYFHGYIQSRLNEAFGRPYRIRNVYFSPGLITTAVLFAITHILNTYSLFTGEGYLS